MYKKKRVPEEENFVGWLHNVNKPKGLNTLKNNIRRKTRIYNAFVLIFWREYSLWIFLHTLFVVFFCFFIVKDHFYIIKIFETFFCFHNILVEVNSNLFELIHINKNMKTKEMKDQTDLFLKILIWNTQKNTASISCV